MFRSLKLTVEKNLYILTDCKKHIIKFGQSLKIQCILIILANIVCHSSIMAFAYFFGICWFCSDTKDLNYSVKGTNKKVRI